MDVSGCEWEGASLLFGEGPLSCCLEGGTDGGGMRIIYELCATSSCPLVGYSMFANPREFGTHFIWDSSAGTTLLEIHVSEESTIISTHWSSIVFLKLYQKNKIK